MTSNKMHLSELQAVILFLIQLIFGPPSEAANTSAGSFIDPVQLLIVSIIPA
jgi:hypothetical protein